MRDFWKKHARTIKALMAVAILAGVGVQVARLLGRPELRLADIPYRPGWLVASAVLYLAGQSCWAAFWVRLLAAQGQPLPLGRGVAVWFVSQMGKYVPGKALALVLRATLTADRVRPGVAVMTGFYETLTAMAAGAVVAAALFPWYVADSSGGWWKALLLLAFAGVPILPGVFNRVVRRLARRVRGPDAPPPAEFGFGTLAGGLLQAAVGWCLLGLSLWACVRGVGLALDWPSCLAFVALAYVAGFVVLVSPGGLGAREFVLMTLLSQELTPALGADAAPAFAAFVAVGLRLVWTAAEAVLSGALWATGATRGGDRPVTLPVTAGDH